MSSYYELLGVTQRATENEIRQGYIKESLKYHPDRNPSPEATHLFQEIATAYYVLSDKDRRNAYDHEQAIDMSEEVNPLAVFGQVLEDLLVPEVPNPVYWYQPLGTAAGAMLGFIVLNLPGALIGGYYGNRAGKVRDLKGKSVYDAFMKLSSERRQEIIGSLAKKFLGQAATATITSK
ncbi:DnaJ domain-containing protein [Gorgonomyces haynaldii]|nr:DnaJ domain-containing protein [Gorgonomyces haynaldii]